MSQVSEISSERSEMSRAQTVQGASAFLKEGWPNGKVGERIRDAARALRWSYTRTKDLWYEDARSISGPEALKLDSLDRKREKAARYEKDEMDRALSLVASHLASEAAKGDRDAALTLREIVRRIDMA